MTALVQLIEPEGRRDNTTARMEQTERLALYRWHELDGLPMRKPLIKGLLDCAAMSVVYGESNCGKTFLALHMSLHVALGLALWGRKVLKGAVIYVAAEGGLGIKERLDAFAKRHLTEEGVLHLEEIPFAVVPTAIDLCALDADAETLIRRIWETFPKDEYPDGVALVVIDTLSRAMAGYNENSSEDMTAFIRNCDRIRQALGCHVLIVHHVGKVVTAGARGHSALRAATDTEIEVVKGNGEAIGMAKVTKQRDRMGGDEVCFKLEQVELCEDEDGEMATSCVVVDPEPDEIPAKCAKHAKPAKLPDGALIALEQLLKAVDKASEVPPPSTNIPTGTKVVRLSIWREICDKVLAPDSDKSDSKGKAFYRARSRLQAAKKIEVFCDWVWPR
jgi:AAA domain